MDGVAVKVLLRPDGEIQRLEGKGAPSVELSKQLQDSTIGGNRTDVVVIGPGVLDALHLA